MKHGSEWYKREPTAYLGGVQGLSTKQHAVYSVILDLIYQHGGSINDDPKWISGWFSDMGSAAVRRTIEDLIDLGKLHREGDQLTNLRAKNEAKTREKLRENRQETGRKGGVSSAKLRASNNENNNLDQPIGSPREEKRREEATTTVPKSGDPRETDPPPEAAAARETKSEMPIDDLYAEVLAAVGHRGASLPAHWMPPAAQLHVSRWRTDLGLTDAQIIFTARESRKRHDEAPNGPKALDRVMANVAAQLTAPRLKAASKPQQKAPRKHFEVMAERMAKTGTEGP